MKPTPAFATEADLCKCFIAAVDAEEWTVYPETGDWDLLLVRKADGFQIGVQAKLAFNPHVISQALDGYWRGDHRGGEPDCRAVLVPAKCSQAYLGEICDYIGLTVITMESPLRHVSLRYNAMFQPALPKYGGDDEYHWHEWAPAKRLKLPDYIPDVTAGVKSPTRLTEWKIKALKIAITLEKRGYLTRKDFGHLRIDHRLWISAEKGWLDIVDGRFVAGPRFPKFKKIHPAVYKQIEESAEAWMLKELSLPLDHQQSLF